MNTARKPSENLSPSQEGEVIQPDGLEDAEELHILDMASQAIIQQQRIRLADNKGDWIKPQGLLGSPEPEVFDPDADDEEELKEQDTTSQDLYRSFVTRASRIPRLSEEEEEAYGKKVRDFDDDDAAKKLVFHNMRLAIKWRTSRRSGRISWTWCRKRPREWPSLLKNGIRTKERALVPTLHTGSVHNSRAF